MRRILGIPAMTVVAGAAFADELPKIDPKYDLNKNGYVEKGTELEVYLAHKRNPTLAKYDTNLNAVLDADEAAVFSESVVSNLEYELALDDLEREIAEQPGIEVATSAPSAGPGEEGDRFPPQYGFGIQSKFQGATIFSPAGPRDDLTGVAPAIASFRRDNISDTEVFSFVGSAFGYWFKHFDGPGLKTGAVTAGIEFDRSVTRHGESPSDTNALAFRAGAEGAFQEGFLSSIASTQFLRADIGWATDFDFDLSVLSLQAKYQPFLAPGMAAPYRIAQGPLRVLWRPRLQAEYQHVFDAAGRSEFQESDDFLFFGPALTTELSFLRGSALDALSLNLSYMAMFDALDLDNEYDYLEASLNWALDPEQHYNLSLTYRYGETPTHRENVDDLMLGFGIRF